MSNKATHMKIEELKTDMAVLKNLEVSIGRITYDKWGKPQGPIPYPETTELRKWDFAGVHADPNWKGIDEKGSYDLALSMGLPYYMEFLILSGLKHYSSVPKTTRLDRYYNPHATWSFPALHVEDWTQSFEMLVGKFRVK